MQTFLRTLVSASLLIACIEAWQCPCGYYCPDPVEKYKAPVLCPVGFTCPEGQYNKTSLPRTCYAGRQCPVAGLCTPLACPCGYYCPSNSSAPTLCKKGFYCPENSTTPKSCKPGECPNSGTCARQCPNGCDENNPPQGFFCVNQYPICLYGCTDVAFCPGSTVLPRPTTRVTNQVALVTTTTPKTYTCGFYVPPGAPSEVPCRKGYYCPSGATPSAQIVPVKCPGGYECPQGACLPTPCPCGYKCPEGSPARIECQPPYYCPSPLATSQTACPVGYKCDRPGLCNATACPPGTFVSCAGKRSCDPCPAGRYCPAATSSLLCPAGGFCAGGSSAPAPCPPRYYCPAGADHPHPCPGGTTSPGGAHSSRQCAARRLLADRLVADWR